MQALYYFILVLLVGCFIQCQSDNTSAQNLNSANALPAEETDFEVAEYKWGYMNKNGKIAIAARFDELRDFREGIAAVRIGGKWGLIDTMGNYLLVPTHKGVFSSHEGRIRYLTYDEKVGYLDRMGKVAIPAQYIDGQDFSEGLARIETEEGFGFINTVGDTIIPPQFARASRFQGGLAKVKKRNNWGLVDRDGEFIIIGEFQKIEWPKEALIRIKKEGQFGFLNLAGELVIPTQYRAATDFYEGVAAVCLATTGKYGLVDQRGQAVTAFEYDKIWYANDNRWAIRADGKYGIMDGEGKVIVTPQFGQLYQFEDGVASYEGKDRLWGLINTEGTQLTTAQFGLLWTCKEGMARAAFREGIGFIDKAGYLRIAPKRNIVDVRDFSEGFAPVQLITQ
ncbi:MAG: WG repeat-containing protein [Bacteroidota bacterium]